MCKRDEYNSERGVRREWRDVCVGKCVNMGVGCVDGEWRCEGCGRGRGMDDGA